MSISRGEAAAERSWPVRPINESEFQSFAAVLYEAFADNRDRESAGQRLRPLVEFDRTLAAFDGDEVVGTAVTHSFRMTLPGGPRPVGGVSAVAVLPTHRRRGILTALMRRQLRDIRERGESVAALWASEAGIYGRFGYGEAARAADITLELSGLRLRDDSPRDPALRVRLTSPSQAAKELAVVHQAAAAQRLGEFARDERWWDRHLDDRAEARGGFSPFKCALVEDGTEPRGYAVYRVQPNWTEYGLPDGTLAVHELFATSPAAHALLWEHVIGRDLITTVRVPNQPLDAPLYGLLTSSARARTVLTDNLWIRLVDVAAALKQRAYLAPVDVVLDITDRMCPWNTGRWRLRAGTGGADCAPTDRAPELRLDIAPLGAAYLGGPLGRYVDSGAVEELRQGAAAELSTALSWPSQPHCTVVF